MYVELWLRAFLATCIVEAIIVALLVHERSRTARITAALIANLATHPIVWFVIPALGFSDPMRRAVSEVWAIGAECVVYRLVFPTATPRKVVAVSLLCNGASLGVGLILRALGVHF